MMKVLILLLTLFCGLLVEATTIRLWNGPGCNTVLGSVVQTISACGCHPISSGSTWSIDVSFTGQTVAAYSDGDCRQRVGEVADHSSCYNTPLKIYSVCIDCGEFGNCNN
ncbi:uncharacterized protein VTP21DRAFT_6986 [Calcarisporiella thermophila]|uniref:uncharacterized protein n=1 Tax=Calcarisporiella thermophila TaxID=911321 RepID=UPI0037434A6D